MAWSTPSSVTTGDLIPAATWNQNVVANPIALQGHAMGVLFDGNLAAISTDAQIDTFCPNAGTITGAYCRSILEAGSITIDLWKIPTSDVASSDTPANSDSIVASAPITLSSEHFTIDTTLTGWTKTFLKGDLIRWRVEAVTTCTLVSAAILFDMG